MCIFEKKDEDGPVLGEYPAVYLSVRLNISRAFCLESFSELGGSSPRDDEHESSSGPTSPRA